MLPSLQTKDSLLLPLRHCTYFLHTFISLVAPPLPRPQKGRFCSERILSAEVFVVYAAPNSGHIAGICTFLPGLCTRAHERRRREEKFSPRRGRGEATTTERKTATTWKPGARLVFINNFCLVYPVTCGGSLSLSLLHPYKSVCLQLRLKNKELSSIQPHTHSPLFGPRANFCSGTRAAK